MTSLLCLQRREQKPDTSQSNYPPNHRRYVDIPGSLQWQGEAGRAGQKKEATVKMKVSWLTTNGGKTRRALHSHRPTGAPSRDHGIAWWSSLRCMVSADRWTPERASMRVPWRARRHIFCRFAILWALVNRRRKRSYSRRRCVFGVFWTRRRETPGQ